MTVKQLIDRLSKVNPEVSVVASDIYGEGTFDIGGMVYDNTGVELLPKEGD